MGGVDMADGLSVFLVEDETLIRMMMTDMVEELGHHVIAEADNVRDASAFAMTAQYDLAILGARPDRRCDGHLLAG